MYFFESKNKLGVINSLIPDSSFSQKSENSATISKQMGAKSGNMGIAFIMISLEYLFLHKMSKIDFVFSETVFIFP